MTSGEQPNKTVAEVQSDRDAKMADRTLLDELTGFDPEFAELFRQFVLDGLYQRNVLDQKTRELCACAALTVTNALPQLTAHIRGAKREGATTEEIQEVMLQACVYGGMPHTLQALRLLRNLVAEGKL